MSTQKQLDSFTAYCKAHPEERFWQALRDWSGANKILADDGNDILSEGVRDTFYWNGRNGKDDE